MPPTHAACGTNFHYTHTNGTLLAVILVSCILLVSICAIDDPFFLMINKMEAALEIA